MRKSTVDFVKEIPFDDLPKFINHWNPYLVELVLRRLKGENL